MPTDLQVFTYCQPQNKQLETDVMPFLKLQTAPGAFVHPELYH